jgi:hypothetical protein
MLDKRYRDEIDPNLKNLRRTRDNPNNSHSLFFQE